ncbi:MAG TPA: carbohydrate ABC transporter permease [Ruminiclostridium sp.]|nr:carbohydrate ABC transporter permease [Ruminiclostridium sp.]
MQNANIAAAQKPPREFHIARYIVLALLTIWAIIQLYPIFWLFLFSLKNNAEIFGGNVLGLPKTWQFGNYSTAMTSGNVGIYFINSLLVTIITIVVSSILIATASYAIVRMKWKLSKFMLTVFMLGLMIPIHAALLPLFVILKDLGFLNTYLALIVPYVAFALPMGIFILTGFLYSIPRELEEAACIDGCNIYQIFYKIIMPLIRPGLATVAIFTYLSTWNELMFANTFINDEKMKTLTVGIMSLSGQYTTDWGPIGAGLMIATIPTLVIYALLSDQVQKSLIVGAVKG